MQNLRFFNKLTGYAESAILVAMTTSRPSPLSRTLALVPPVVALVAQHADGSMFLKVETSGGPTITGESTDSKHSGWIEINSMQLGVANQTSLSGGQITGGKSTRSDLTLTKLLDKSSPPLFLGCAQGTTYPTLTLELTTPNSSGTALTFYKITLTNVIVSSLSSAANGERPGETVALSYEKITTDYYMVDAKGGVPVNPTATATWNFATNSTK